MKQKHFEAVFNHGEFRQILFLPEKPYKVIFVYPNREVVLCEPEGKLGLYVVETTEKSDIGYNSKNPWTNKRTMNKDDSDRTVPPKRLKLSSKTTQTTCIENCTDFPNLTVPKLVSEADIFSSPCTVAEIIILDGHGTVRNLSSVEEQIETADLQCKPDFSKKANIHYSKETLPTQQTKAVIYTKTKDNLNTVCDKQKEKTLSCETPKISDSIVLKDCNLKHNLADVEDAIELHGYQREPVLLKSVNIQHPKKTFAIEQSKTVICTKTKGNTVCDKQNEDTLSCDNPKIVLKNFSLNNNLATSKKQINIADSQSEAVLLKRLNIQQPRGTFSTKQSKTVICTKTKDNLNTVYDKQIGDTASCESPKLGDAEDDIVLKECILNTNLVINKNSERKNAFNPIVLVERLHVPIAGQIILPAQQNENVIATKAKQISTFICDKQGENTNQDLTCEKSQNNYVEEDDISSESRIEYPREIIFHPEQSTVVDWDKNWQYQNTIYDKQNAENTLIFSNGCSLKSTGVRKSCVVSSDSHVHYAMKRTFHTHQHEIKDCIKSDCKKNLYSDCNNKNAKSKSDFSHEITPKSGNVEESSVSCSQCENSSQQGNLQITIESTCSLSENADSWSDMKQEDGVTDQGNYMQAESSEMICSSKNQEKKWKKTYSRCAYCYCKQSQFPDRRYFSFPANEDMCKKWVLLCNKKSLLKKTVAQLHRSYRLCSKHFHESDFTTNKLYHLQPSAVPNFQPRQSLGTGPNPKPRVVRKCLPSNNHSHRIRKIFPSVGKIGPKSIPPVTTKYPPIDRHALRTQLNEKISHKIQCCDANLCNNNSSNYSGAFFRFPNNPERLSKWLENVGPLTSTRRYKLLCRDHFHMQSFVDTFRKRLHKNAIPFKAHQDILYTAVSETGE